MSARELLAIRNEVPFVPMRLVVTDGRAYDVKHPELLTVGKYASVIGVADKDEDFVLADHFVRIVNEHITTAIPLTVADQVG